MKAKLLVVDDEPNIVYSVQQCLASNDLEVISASTGQRGIDVARQSRPDVVLLDVRLPDMSGLEVYAEMRRSDPCLSVVLMTAYAKSATAIEAMSRGAFDYLIKPVELAKLKDVIGKALASSRLNRVPAVLPADEQSNENADHILGISPAMQDVYKTIGRVAQHDAPVLILGESGTGKELIARAIYHYSRRRERPFLAINCAALPETLLESELFGHEKGAFTGADHRRVGKFEQVNGGTLLLDEIGDMSLVTQAKALRLLQDQQFERVGGNATVKTDVRIIAATNQDLHHLVETGRFRLDLLYRLNGFTIKLPALRQRPEDIPLLTDQFLRNNCRELQRPLPVLSDAVRRRLQEHSWPGNVRELQNTIRYAAVHSTGTKIEIDDLPPEHRESNANPLDGADARWGLSVEARAQALFNDGQNDVYRRLQGEFDEALLSLAWKHTEGNQARMAELLGLSRMTLRGKLRACGLLSEE